METVGEAIILSLSRISKDEVWNLQDDRSVAWGRNRARSVGKMAGPSHPQPPLFHMEQGK